MNAVMLACECTAWYAERSMTLLDAMNELYKIWLNGLIAKAFEGQDGMKAMENLMVSLRTTPFAEIADRKIVGVVDYQNGSAGLLPSDILEF